MKIIYKWIDTPEDIEDQIQEYLCKQSPTGFAEFVNKIVVPPKDILNGTTALALMMCRAKAHM